MGNLCFARPHPSSAEDGEENDNNIPKVQQDSIYIIEQTIIASYKNGKFYEGHKKNNIKVAIKKSSQHQITKEFEILGNLQQHTNILQCLNRAQINREYVLVTEIFNETLQEAFKRDLNGKSMMLQLANAVDYLNHQNIIHLDIAPRNIFIVTVGREEILKLGNFENSHRGKEVTNVNHNDLTVGFKAPEILSRATAYQESCLWSLGCVFFFMVTKGFKIIDAPSSSEKKILARLNAMIDNTTNDNILIKDLLTKVLRQNLSDRIKCPSISEHPYFWSAMQTLNFIVEVGIAIESPTEFYKQILNGQQKVLNGNWTEKIDQELLEILKNTAKNYKQKYGNGDGEQQEENFNGHKITKMITTIRNMKCHYRSQEVKNIVGESDGEFLNYWTSRFPGLIMHLINSIEQHQKLKPLNTNYESNLII